MSYISEYNSDTEKPIQSLGLHIAHNTTKQLHMKAVTPEIMRDFYSPTRSRRKFNSALFIQLSISNVLTPCGQGHHLKCRQLHIEPLFVGVVFADDTEFI